MNDALAPCEHPFPQETCENKDVPVAVAAGGNHTLILFESGYLTVTGSKQSSFGKQYTSNSEIILHSVKLCSATWDAYILCTTQDSILTYGKGEKGELGRGLNTISARVPSPPVDMSGLLPHGVSVVDLASGLQHTVLVLSNGQVVGWGNGRKGQLGQPPEVVWEPRKIDGLDFKVHRAVCGREFTYLVGESTEGRHLILGSDKWGTRSAAPVTIRFWKDIGASWGSIFVLRQSGEITAWGRNDHGQLPPRMLPKLAKIAIGSEHALALTVNGQVLAWGWGEHGNCGPTSDENGDVKDYNILTIPSDPHRPGSSILGIGAGCATSWIWSKDIYS